MKGLSLGGKTSGRERAIAQDERWSTSAFFKILAL
jgi:hypothetical protein